MAAGPLSKLLQSRFDGEAILTFVAYYGSEQEAQLSQRGRSMQMLRDRL